MAAIHALFDLGSMPEYIDELREEIQSVRSVEDSGWSFETIEGLRRLDSFLKESMRMNQPDSCMSFQNAICLKANCRKWV